METLEAQLVPVKDAQIQLEQTTLDQKLNLLKSLNLNSAIINIYVANISTRNKGKRFLGIKRLKVHSENKEEFKGYVVKCIEDNNHINELKTLYTAQDNRFFYVEKAATDFSQMEELVTTGNIPYVTNIKELNDYNAYVIQLTFGEQEQSVFAFRYISGSWRVNKTSGKSLTFSTINNELIVSIDETPHFQMTSNIDFIQFKDDIFIADIRQFEIAMNYHQRLKEKKEEAITALCASASLISTSKDTLEAVIGSDKHLMRQLASVHEKGYYSNDIWLTKLEAAAEKAGNWKVKFNEQGEILVENNKDYVKELLTLLQNKRVKTVVDDVMFDVDGELIALEVAK